MATSPARPSSGPTTLSLRYRSAGSFLVAYARHLSRGELFVETTRPWPLGTRVDLRLHTAAGAPLEMAATVIWARPTAIAPGQPGGMGLALASAVDAHGAAIDTLASLFMGTRILLGSADPTSGLSFLLPAFAAAFLGATTIMPGRFNPIGSIAAVYFLVTGITGLQLLGVQTFVQQLFYGGALVLAVALSQLARRRSASGADR